MRNEHLIRNAVIADFSGVLLHYKFTNTFVSKALKYAEEENHWQDSYEYKKYRAAIQDNEDLSLKTSNFEELTGPDKLIEGGIYVISDQFDREFLRDLPPD
jgi:hypothetical protein